MDVVWILVGAVVLESSVLGAWSNVGISQGAERVIAIMLGGPGC
jgi:hypothetical protein